MWFLCFDTNLGSFSTPSGSYHCIMTSAELMLEICLVQPRTEPRGTDVGTTLLADLTCMISWNTLYDAGSLVKYTVI